MNILVVHEADYIDQVVYEYQIIPEILSSRGHKVSIIDFSSQRKSGHTYHNVSKAYKKGGVTVVRPFILKFPGLARLSAFITHFWAIHRIIVKNNIDHIILYSVPTNGLQTLFWAKIYKIPVLFRLLDVIHELAANRFVKCPIYILEKIVYRLADQVLAVTPRITKYAVSMGANPRSTSYLPTGADNDLFYPKRKNQRLLKKYGLNSKDLIILFAGTLFRFSGLDEIIQRMPHHLSGFPNLKLVIVGRGEQEKKLRTLVKKLKLQKNVIFTGFIDYQKLADYINLADVCINPFKITPATDLIFPGKIYQYAASGKPTVTTKLQGVVNLFPPAKSNRHGIFYYESTDEFFWLLPSLAKKKFRNPHPSIQKITKTIEKSLESMSVSIKSVSSLK